MKRQYAPKCTMQTGFRPRPRPRAPECRVKKKSATLSPGKTNMADSLGEGQPDFLIYWRVVVWVTPLKKFSFVF